MSACVRPSLQSAHPEASDHGNRTEGIRQVFLPDSFRDLLSRRRAFALGRLPGVQFVYKWRQREGSWHLPSSKERRSNRRASRSESTTSDSTRTPTHPIPCCSFVSVPVVC